MTTAAIQIDSGSTLNTATYTISEDAVTKHIPRSAVTDSAGSLIDFATSAKQLAAGHDVSIANSGGWVVNVANTSSLYSIVNSAGWVVTVDSVPVTHVIIDTANFTDHVVIDSAALAYVIVNSSAYEQHIIVDSAPVISGVVSVANTGGSVTIASGVVSVANTDGLIVNVANTSGLIAVTNTAGWVVSVSNTGGVYSSNISNATFVAKSFQFSASTNGIIWDPTAGTKFVICDLIISAVSAGILDVYDSTTDLRVIKASFAANGGAVSNFTKPYISAATDNILSWATGAGAQGFGSITGYEV